MGQSWLTPKSKRNTVWWSPPKRIKYVDPWDFSRYGKDHDGGKSRKRRFIKLAKGGATAIELSKLLESTHDTAIKRLEKLGFKRYRPGPRNHSGFKELKLALKNPVCEKNGWPDALNIEQKIGIDFFKKEQWIRAAWLLKYHKRDVIVSTAKNKLDAVLGKGVVFSSVAEFVRSFGIAEMEKAWFRLVKIVSEAP